MTPRQRLTTLGRWLVLGCLVGALCGGASALFLWLLGLATSFRELHQQLVYALPLAGLAIGFVYERFGQAIKAGNNLIIDTIHDDGPGFAPEILARLGEPYVTTRGHRFKDDTGESGLGLGFFIAKTLLERSGATVEFENRAYPDRGAVIRVRWLRGEFERPLGLAAT